MIAVTRLEYYNSVFSVIDHNNKFAAYKNW